MRFALAFVRFALAFGCLLSTGVAWADAAVDWQHIQPVTLPAAATLTVRGALRSSHDGSVIDAATTKHGDARIEPGGLLDFEAGGLRLVSQDVDHHEYQFSAAPTPGSGCVAVQLPSPCLVPRLLPLAQARLLTMADFTATLSGQLAMDAPRARTAWRWGWTLALVGAAGVVLGVGRRRRRRASAIAYKEAQQLMGSLRRRLRKGDPVHQRILPTVAALGAGIQRLEFERKRGLSEGWPAEAAQAETKLQAIVTSLRALHRSLDGATRLDRAALDPRLLTDLDRGLANAQSAIHDVQRTVAD